MCRLSTTEHPLRNRCLPNAQNRRCNRPFRQAQLHFNLGPHPGVLAGAVAVDSRPKTAIVTPFGLYQFNVMPFGLQRAPATFQRLMDRVLQGLGEYSAAYLDDVVVYSETWEEHLHNTLAVLQRLREAGLTAKARKCNFGSRQCLPRAPG